MPDIKLRDSSGVETTYENVNTIEVPLADGSGTIKYGKGDFNGIFNVTSSLSILGYSPIVEGVLPLADELTFTNMVNLSNLPSSQVLSDKVQNSTIYYSDIINTTTGFRFFINNSTNFYHLPTFVNTNAHPLYVMYITGFPKDNWNVPQQEFENFLSQVEAFTFRGYNEVSGSSSNASLDSNFFNSSSQTKYCINNYDNMGAIFKMLHEKIMSNIETNGWNNSTSSLNIRDYSARWLTNIPVLYRRGTSSSSSTVSINSCDFLNLYCVKHLTFYTDNGIPLSMPIYTNNMQLLSNIGYYYTDGLPNNYDDFTIINSPETYEAHKDNLYHCISVGNTMKYNYTNKAGNTVSLGSGLAYSSYNHDSAVETINSLWDGTQWNLTSTITFKAYSGALTDEGAIENLTEEEIAVATEKGWTVAFNTSTT